MKALTLASLLLAGCLLAGCGGPAYDKEDPTPAQGNQFETGGQAGADKMGSANTPDSEASDS